MTTKYQNLYNYVQGKPHMEDTYTVLYKHHVETSLRPGMRKMLKILHSKGSSKQEQQMSLHTIDEVFHPFLNQ